MAVCISSEDSHVQRSNRQANGKHSMGENIFVQANENSTKPERLSGKELHKVQM